MKENTAGDDAQLFLDFIASIRKQKPKTRKIVSLGAKSAKGKGNSASLFADVDLLLDKNEKNRTYE